MNFSITLHAEPSLLAALNHIALALSREKNTAPGTDPIDIKETSCPPADDNYPFDGTDISIEEIRAKAISLNQLGLKREIKTLLDTHSASSISTLPETAYAGFLEALITLERSLSSSASRYDIND